MRLAGPALVALAGCTAAGAASAPPPDWYAPAAVPGDCGGIAAHGAPATLPRLDWRPCDFAAGCELIDAPWAEAVGWGYGGLLSVAHARGATWLSLARALGPGRWESVVYRDDVPVAAWRQDAASGCALGGPWLAADGTAALVVLREHALTAPIVLVGRPEALHVAPDRIERFGAAGTAVLPRDVAQLDDRHLLLWEQLGRFAVRDRVTGATERPTLLGAPEAELDQAQLVDGVIAYVARDGETSSIRIQGDRLDAADTWDDRLAAADGAIAFVRARERLGGDRWNAIELWTATLGDGPVRARRVAALPPGELPLVSIGSGWIAVRRAPDDVTLFPLGGGSPRRLPAIEGVAWDGGVHGLVLVARHVWVKAALAARPGNDVQWIVRLAIDALAPADDLTE